MANQTLTKNFIAEAGISAYRVVKFGSTDDYVVQAAAAGDSVIGVVEGVAPSAGERCDVVLAGIAEVTLGGAVTRGGGVVSDAWPAGPPALAPARWPAGAGGSYANAPTDAFLMGGYLRGWYRTTNGGSCTAQCHGSETYP